MNIFNKVTLKSLQKNKTRTVVTIIGIILSAAMICAVTTFVSSIRNFALQTSIYYDGNWHGRELNTSFETCEEVSSDDRIEYVGYVQQLGYAVAEGCQNEYKPYIYLLGAAENIDDVLPLHITEGRYPENANEILLPNHLYTNGSLKFSIGDTITLDLGSRLSDGYPMTQQNPCYSYDDRGNEVLDEETIEVRESRTFTVVGFYDRLSIDIEEITAPGYTAFTVIDKDLLSSAPCDVYFRMDNPEKVYSFMNEKGFSGGQNRDVLMYSGISRFDSFKFMLYSLAAIVIALIMFGSVSLIYNAFSISVSERTKQFGLLSSVGATKKQLRKMVLFEALTVSAVGIPLGILAGIGGIGVTLMLIGDKFISMGFKTDLKMSVSPISVVIAAVIALITVLISAWIPSVRATRVSAVEAIRQNVDINAKGKQVKTSKLTYKLFGLPGVLASKHYKRSKKKYRTTVLSLFMSIVLFVSASAFTDYLMESVEGSFGADGFDLWLYTDDEYLSELTEDELLSKIKESKSVTGAAYADTSYINVEIDRKYLTEKVLEDIDSWSYQGEGRDPSAAHIHAYLHFIDDESFRSLLREHGLSEEEYMNESDPLAVVLDGCVSFNYAKEKYESVKYLNTDNCEFTVREIKKIDGYWIYGETTNENGNTVFRYVKDDGSNYEDSEYLDVPLEEAYIYTTLKTGKVIYERPFFVRKCDGVSLIYPISLADDICAYWSYFNFDYYITSDNHSESYNAIRDMLSANNLNIGHLQNYAEQEESSRNIVTIIKVFSYGFIVLISLIAAANVFNTISTNISLRRREFAMLKSVGMDAKGFNKMMNFECLLYGSRALLYGLPVSVGMTYLIWRAVSEGYETGFTLPWTSICIATLSVFAVVFVTMVYAMNKVKKDNPIDALKNENL